MQTRIQLHSAHLHAIHPDLLKHSVLLLKTQHRRIPGLY